MLSGLSAATYNSISVVTSGCQYNNLGPRTLFDPPIPDAPAVVAQSYCQYDAAVRLTATGMNLFWYGPGISGGSTTAPIPLTSVAGVDSYFVTQTVAGCTSPRAADPVTITAKPAPPRVSDTSYCQGSVAHMLTAGGINLAWYTDTTSAALATTPVPPTTTIGRTTWYVSQKVNGCSSSRVPLVVTILYRPVFRITQSRPWVCQYDTITFNYSGPLLSAALFNWGFGHGESIAVGNDSTATIVVRFDSVYNDFVALKASDFDGRCSSTDTLPIKVLPEPYATSYVKDNVCAGQPASIAISAASANAARFTWNFDGADIIAGTNNGPYSVIWSTPGVYLVSLSAATVEGCSSLQNFDTVRVLPTPDASIYSYTTNKSICMEDSVFLSAIDTSDFGNSYYWAPAHFFENLNKPAIWGKIDYPGYVTLTITNPYGCVATDSVMITPDACCTVSFPTAFTPNNDGKNDLFRPIFNGFHNFHMFRIENRWGQVVFESTNNSVAWDGTMKGVPQDMGTYFYFIKFDCGGQDFESKGTVTLIR